MDMMDIGVEEPYKDIAEQLTRWRYLERHDGDAGAEAAWPAPVSAGRPSNRRGGVPLVGMSGLSAVRYRYRLHRQIFESGGEQKLPREDGCWRASAR
jgi:hypothetical protein